MPVTGNWCYPLFTEFKKIVNGYSYVFLFPEQHNISSRTLLFFIFLAENLSENSWDPYVKKRMDLNEA